MTLNIGDAQRIGRVTSVQSEQVTVALESEGMVTAGVEGVASVGTLNSYITLAAAHQRVVAVVTGIRIEPTSDGAVRILEATMVGRIEGQRYRPGVAAYPSIDATVWAATNADIQRIFAPPGESPVAIGDAVVAPEFRVSVNGDLLLAYHAAVLGATGTGKSCTVTALLDAITESETPSATILIFDTTGEYSKAFGRGTARGTRTNAVVLGPEPGPVGVLVAPSWFMDTEDHASFALAREGVQAPVLHRAIADARLANEDRKSLLSQLRILGLSLDTIRYQSTSHESRKPQTSLAAVLTPLEATLTAFAGEAAAVGDSEVQAMWEGAANIARQSIAGLKLDTTSWDPLGPHQLASLDVLLNEFERVTANALSLLGLPAAAAAFDFDAPRYYAFADLLSTYLPNRIALDSLTEPRLRAYVAPMTMRLARFLADSRYDFMTRVERYDDALAKFLRLILGWNPPTDEAAAPWAAAYQRRVGDDTRHQVVILDLSLIASDVLETVTALLARLVFGFAQRAQVRAGFPILLVLEEAHRYIPAAQGETQSRSAAAFERIAKEGRKYGVGLVLASQRPSELSKTVLSQCGTLIVHRVSNTDDQEMVRAAAPSAGREVLRQLPGLARQHAVLLGQAVSAPTYVRIRDVLDPPKSQDPEFMRVWSAPATAATGDEIDAIARRWERSEG
ncbi:MAG: ATP-binding protein [Candidatus Limnocylindria bacterium]